MAKSIVIVESPTKVKTINKILGAKYKVVSSMGHLIDLPKSTLGVDVDKDFEPKFIVVRSKQKQLSILKKESKSADEIYFATDPDREGEAIGWNLINHIGEGKKIYRVSFQEITKEAVLKAFEHPRKFDEQKVNAQIARRLLDRIVGYMISPLLWKKVGSRLSAGRVQSVALRLIVEREREIKAFTPQEYWEITADLFKSSKDNLLNASLEKINGEKFIIKDQAEADATVADVKKQKFIVSDIVQKESRRKALPPLITSTMQQDAFNKMKFNANRTMLIAQQLYEGIDLGDGETVGLITYMRTDSVNISQDAMGKLRDYIKKNYGKEYLPETPNVYKSKKSAQEAHEAIRPSDVNRKPQDIAKYLEPDQLKLYTLIWNRFVASQMTPAVYEQNRLEITAGKYFFSASGSTLLFDGYQCLQRDEDSEEEKKVDFSKYNKDDVLTVSELHSSQHFTKPPPRYSDASLVKALEEDGIGRPSTYASIISTIVLRNYVLRDKGYLKPTDLGIQVSDIVVEYFARIMDVGFTAKMEETLDEVEEGKVEYQELLADFYKPFVQELKHAENTITKTTQEVGRPCPLCGSPLVYKWGRKGRFISCSTFPACKHAEPITTGIICPKEGCGGKLIQRSSRRGSFYGCTHYPKCDFVSKELPETSKNS